MNIDSWVNRRVAEIINGPNAEKEFVKWAKNRPELTGHFACIVEKDEDLGHACAWPHAEISTICAFVSRFLHRNLFNGPMYGNVSEEAKFIDSVVASMGKTKSQKGS